MRQPKELKQPGAHLILRAPLRDGPHELVSRLKLKPRPLGLFSFDPGDRWKLTARLSFDTRAGLRTEVRTGPEQLIDGAESSDKFKIVNQVTPRPLAPIEGPSLGPVVARLPALPAVPATEPPRPKPPSAARTPVGAALAMPSPSPAPKSTLGRLLLEVTAGGAPVAATIRLRGTDQAQRDLSGRSAVTPLELAPGSYVLEVLAPGLLGQSRTIDVPAGGEQKISVALVPSPAKREADLKGTRLKVARPPRFRIGESQLAPESSRLLAELVDVLVRSPGQGLRLEGHSDGRESKAAQALSEARANAVMEALAANGIPKDRLQAVGFADTRPKTPNLTPRGRAFNRRVEVSLVPVSAPGA